MCLPLLSFDGTPRATCSRPAGHTGECTAVVGWVRHNWTDESADGWRMQRAELPCTCGDCRSLGCDPDCQRPGCAS